MTMRATLTIFKGTTITSSQVRHISMHGIFSIHSGKKKGILFAFSIFQGSYFRFFICFFTGFTQPFASSAPENRFAVNGPPRSSPPWPLRPSRGPGWWEVMNKSGLECENVELCSWIYETMNLWIYDKLWIYDELWIYQSMMNYESMSRIHIDPMLNLWIYEELWGAPLTVLARSFSLKNAWQMEIIPSRVEITSQSWNDQKA